MRDAYIRHSYKTNVINPRECTLSWESGTARRLAAARKQIASQFEIAGAIGEFAGAERFPARSGLKPAIRFDTDIPYLPYCVISQCTVAQIWFQRIFATFTRKKKNSSPSFISASLSSLSSNLHRHRLLFLQIPLFSPVFFFLSFLFLLPFPCFSLIPFPSFLSLFF